MESIVSAQQGLITVHDLVQQVNIAVLKIYSILLHRASKLRVENFTIRRVDPEKKGQWWFSGDASTATEDIGKVAVKIDRDDVHEAQKMLKLAAKQRMNTDTRRAIFCVTLMHLSSF